MFGTFGVNVPHFFHLLLHPNTPVIFSEISQCMELGQVKPKSAMVADIVSIGDSWLGYSIRKGLLEPVKNAEEHDWFRSLSDRWKDWEDLWRSELAGKIAMVDSPREVIGAVLKHLGSSYNTVDMETDVSGGREAVLRSFTQLQKHVPPRYRSNYSTA